jgi:L-alanine-DL-glutamate epimerase-like enolase superfamily enzyme
VADAVSFEAAAQQLGVPLHAWLGGAVRPRVSLAPVMPIEAVRGALAGVRRVVLASAERDAARLISQLDAAAQAL